MTITDNGRVELDEQTLAKGRELTAGGKLPGKREMQRHLGKGWPIVNEVLTRLGDEVAERTTAKRREARRKIKTLQSRKRSGSTRPVLPERQRTVNEIIPTAIVEPAVELVAPAIPEAAQKHPGTAPVTVNETPVAEPIKPGSKVIRTWPILIVAAGAFVAIWAGWVGLGQLTGFGDMNLLPGLVDDGKWSTVDTKITLPLGMEAYSAYAFYVLLHRSAPKRARVFAAWSSLGAVLLGMAGQTAYHLMAAKQITAAPWEITTVVSCLPVAVFGLAAALVHMVRAGEGVND